MSDLLNPFDPQKDYLSLLNKGEYLEKEGDKLPRLKGLQRLAHNNRGGVNSVFSNVVNTPARDNPIASVTIQYTFADGTTFSGSADATTTAHDAPYNLHLVAVAESKAEARALRRAFNISAVAAEEIGSAPIAGKDDGPIGDLTVQGIMKIGDRKGLDEKKILGLIGGHDATSIKDLTAQQGRDLLKALNKNRKRVAKK